MALTKRVEVLFDPDEYRALEPASQAVGEPVGSLIRKAVAEKYLEADLERRRAALDDLLRIELDFTWEDAKHILDKDIGRRLWCCLTPTFLSTLGASPIR